MAIWTDEMLSLLRQQMADGYSAMTAAKVLSSLSPGLTRNAVIGKASRLGLVWMRQPLGRPPSGPRTPYIRWRHPRVRKAPAAPSLLRLTEVRPRDEREPVSDPGLAAQQETSSGVTIADLADNGCRWLSGDLYCGVVVEGRNSFCAHHHRLAHRRVA